MFRRLFDADDVKVIPGSHLWDNGRPPLLRDVEYATMEKGDAYVMLGSTYHAGGENKTLNEKRPLHALFFCRGYYRQEVCILLLSLTADVLTQYSRKINISFTQRKRFSLGRLRYRVLWDTRSRAPILGLWISSSQISICREIMILIICMIWILLRRQSRGTKIEILYQDIVLMGFFKALS